MSSTTATASSSKQQQMCWHFNAPGGCTKPGCKRTHAIVCRNFDPITKGGCPHKDNCHFHHFVPSHAATTAVVSAARSVATRPPAAPATDRQLANMLGSLGISLPPAPPNSKQQLTAEIHVTQTVQRPKTVAARKMRSPFQVYFLLDDSGSMSGHTFNQAIEGISHVLEELKEEDDWVGMASFSNKQGGSSLHDRLDFVPLKSNREAVERHIAAQRAKGACGSSTALYGAMIEAVQQFRAYPHLPDLQHVLIVATDGENNVDGHILTAEKVNEALHQARVDRKLNLHVTILPIALPDSLHGEFRKILAGKPPSAGGVKHPKLGELHNCKDASVIKEQFRKAYRTMMETVEVTTTLAISQKRDGTSSARAISSTTAAAHSSSGRGSGKGDPVASSGKKKAN